MRAILLLSIASIPVLGEDALESERVPDAARVVPGDTGGEPHGVPLARSRDLRRVQGTWDVVRHAAGGTGFGTRDGSGEPLGPRVVISGAKATFSFPGNANAKPSKYEIVAIDESATPRRVDIELHRDGETSIQRGIYALRGTTIVCELANPGGPRPADFSTAGREATSLLVLRRVADE